MCMCVYVCIYLYLRYLTVRCRNDAEIWKAGRSRKALEIGVHLNISVAVAENGPQQVGDARTETKFRQADPDMADDGRDFY